jgi:glucans biosynthesis protein
MNIYDSKMAMHNSLRCGAQTRKEMPCPNPAVQGKKRCRMHGGAKGSGAPLNNKNALKSGYYTREEIARRREVDQALRECNKVIAQAKAKHDRPSP